MKIRVGLEDGCWAGFFPLRDNLFIGSKNKEKQTVLLLVGKN